MVVLLSAFRRKNPRSFSAVCGHAVFGVGRREQWRLGGRGRRGRELGIVVKVQDEELRLLRPVAGPDGADELRPGRLDAPDDAARAARLEHDQVAHKLAGANVPQLDGAVVGRGDDEVAVELEARHGRLVLVWT